MNDENLVAVLGQQIRIDIRWGTGIPLVLCNGIGAILEVLDPFVEQLDPNTTVVRFDVPGSGDSPGSTRAGHRGISTPSAKPKTVRLIR